MCDDQDEKLKPHYKTCGLTLNLGCVSENFAFDFYKISKNNATVCS